mmetsp:Transcript_41446/g.105532  ORF Transcript_41446/g.105532 Transcript_41446/m.105532 type:complete len:231 (-) Transcript_41446:624-1316(-)
MVALHAGVPAARLAGLRRGPAEAQRCSQCTGEDHGGQGDTDVEAGHVSARPLALGRHLGPGQPPDVGAGEEGGPSPARQPRLDRARRRQQRLAVHELEQGGQLNEPRGGGRRQLTARRRGRIAAGDGRHEADARGGDLPDLGQPPGPRRRPRRPGRACDAVDRGLVRDRAARAPARCRRARLRGHRGGRARLLGPRRLDVGRRDKAGEIELGCKVCGRSTVCLHRHAAHE